MEENHSQRRIQTKGEPYNRRLDTHRGAGPAGDLRQIRTLLRQVFTFDALKAPKKND